MTDYVSAVRQFFEERNKTWITREASTLSNFIQSSASKDTVKRFYEEAELKYRSMKHRQRNLLRSHTKISITPLPSDAHSQEHRGPDGTQRIQVTEHINWVYGDRTEYRVESRRIQHIQKWKQSGDQWKLVSARVSGEGHSLDTGRTAQELQTGIRDIVQPTQNQCVVYDRVRAQRYAELWWDGWNPAYPNLTDDCTDFISQCLYAGGMPMKGQPNRSNGWWIEFQKNWSAEPWSYSWTTSHALYQYLTKKMGAKLVRDPKTLKVGDLVFYDWNGEGRFHHTTIVTDVDNAGDPLVNAHTDPSYHRHYLYLDSRAWTTRTRYQYVQLPKQLC